MTDSISTQPQPGTLRRFVACCSQMTQRDRRNARRANYWLFGWMLSFVGIIFAIRSEVLPEWWLTWLAIAASTVLGFVAIMAFVRFLREADELLRKIQFEALALGFGAAMIANFTLSLVERVREQPFEIGDLFMVMVIFYVIGVITGTRRYA